MEKKMKNTIAGFSAAAAMFFCSPSFAGITLGGSTTVLPLAQEAAETYMDENPDADISVRGGGSGSGITELIDGALDIADASRAVLPAEKAKAASENIVLKASPVARDAVAVIVHPSNKIKNLSEKQIRGIFTGGINNWKEVGGADEKIVVVSRDSSSGTFEVFEELALNKEKVRKDALMQASNRGVAEVIASAEGAIGYVGLGYLSAKVKAVSVSGIMPSAATVSSGKYAYSRLLYMYTRGEPRGAVKEFIDFVRGKEGQKIAGDLGFIPLR